MRSKYTRHDFLIKDLVISIAGSSRGGTWMPGPDQETPPSPISPIASVLVNIDMIEAVRATVVEALESGKGFEAIGNSFVMGRMDGNATLQQAIFDIGAEVVASAAYATLGKGSIGYPNPDCGGTSLETIPTPITPFVNIGRRVHQVTELPRLRAQLKESVKYLEQAAIAQAPTTDEVGMVAEHLQSALKSLGR